MTTSLWSAVTGINTFEKALNAESNNLANTNTVGHKADDVRFEDLMYKNGVGRGSAVESVTKQNQQGNLKITGNDYDVAIDGKGYFIVKDELSNTEYYTRSGNFRMAADGQLVNSDNMKVLGLTPNPSTVIATNSDEKQFTTDYTLFAASKTINDGTQIQTINAKTTNYNLTAQDYSESGNNFKSKSSLIADIEALKVDYNEKLDLYSTTSQVLPTESTKQITTINFASSMEQLDNEEDFISVNINGNNIKQKFDTNIETTLKKFSDKISSIQGLTSSVDTQTGIVTISSLVPAKEFFVDNSLINSSYAPIENTQEATLGSGIGMLNSSRNALKEAIEKAGSKFMEINSSISLTNQTDLNVSPIQLKLSEIGVSETQFGKIEMDDGLIFMKDGDNKFVVGKIQTAFFTNPQGLIPQGDNRYSISLESGNPMYAGDVNTVVGKALELSTANVADSLTNVLVYQKSFEANSKSITTSDELLKIALELKK